jgi:hypothetical protein
MSDQTDMTAMASAHKAMLLDLEQQLSYASGMNLGVGQLQDHCEKLRKMIGDHFSKFPG